MRPRQGSAVIWRLITRDSRTAANGRIPTWVRTGGGRPKTIVGNFRLLAGPEHVIDNEGFVGWAPAPWKTHVLHP